MFARNGDKNPKIRVWGELEVTSRRPLEQIFD